jgi:hypothetical protein
MSLDEELIRALDIAFQESDVSGVRLSEDKASVELLVEVRFLPETGPEADERRILVFRKPALLQVLVRLETSYKDPSLGPAIPISGLDDLEQLFASLVWTDSQMQAWEYIDAPRLPGGEWPDSVSLDMPFQDGSEEHRFWWGLQGFSESQPNGERFDIEGLIYFADLEVYQADGKEIALAVFAADGRRWWDALYGRNEYSSQEVQRVASAGPSWRAKGSHASLIIPAGPEAPSDIGLREP